MKGVSNDARENDPSYKHGLALIPAWISNHMHSINCDNITYPFPNFNAATVEVWDGLVILFHIL